MKLLFLLILITFGCQSFSQKEDSVVERKNSFNTDRDAKYAVLKIVQYSGLTPNFIVVEDESIKNALAYVKNKQRYIKYNPVFMKRVNDSTETDWAAISVLAHEIGHHLLGHTIDNNPSNPGRELAADKYSGFVLFNMGATLDEALRCVESEGSLHGTKTHPPKEARVDAITSGWNEAKELKDNKVVMYSRVKDDNIIESFKYQCKFIGDENTYYVNDAFQVVWYDNYANPIQLGKIVVSDNKSYKWYYDYNNLRYAIDYSGTIWLMTTHGAVMEVGEMKEMIISKD